MYILYMQTHLQNELYVQIDDLDDLELVHEHHEPLDQGSLQNFYLSNLYYSWNKLEKIELL